MKKLLLAAAVTTLSLSAAQAAPTLYGKLNVSIDQVDNYDFEGNDVSEVSSHASRLGVKGEEKLTDKLSAVYQAEWAVSTDGSGSDTDWSARNRFLGLKTEGVGTLKVGQYDSYFKTAAGKYQDIFNDHTRLDMTKIMYGEERLKNVVGFETDKKLLGGLQFSAMAQQGEGSASDYTTEDRDSFGDSVSTALSYDNKDLGLALAVAGNLAVQGDYAAYGLKDVESDAVRVTGSYNFKALGLSGLTLGALWQQAELSDAPSAAALEAAKLKPVAASLEEQAVGVTATYSFANTPWTLKGQYHTVESTADGQVDRNIDQYGLGLDYKMNKQARLYTFVAQQERDWENDDTMTAMGLGMEYNF